MTQYIPIFQSGGIGDLIVGLPFVELFRGHAVRYYTCFPEVAAIYLPWVEIVPRTQLQVDSPDWNIELIDIVRFVFRKNCQLPEFMRGWYRTYLSRYPDWLTLIEGHPRTCNEMAHKATDLGLDRTTLAHYLIGEPYKPYVLDEVHQTGSHFTVHDGFDSTCRFDVSMKSWPIPHWEALVEELKAFGPVFQIGGPKHRVIRNVDKNFANTLPFQDSLNWLYSSRLHIDGDSGLVHARHLVRKRSIVLFGPTNPKYFGYSENTNIPPKFCGDCWWKKPDWMPRCVKDYEKAECMYSIKPHEVFKRIKRICL